LCRLQACESPLLVAVAAGSLALPTLLKLATVMAGQNQDFLTCNQLPVVSTSLPTLDATSAFLGMS
jgi:hypothetical protein